MEQPFIPMSKPHVCLSFALHYIARGWRVLPLHTITDQQQCSCGRTNCPSAGKHPMTTNGVKEAVCDAAQAKEWWKWRSGTAMPNVGVATGNGLLVIDLDPRHGGTLEALAALTEIPETMYCTTGGGGWHYYFTYDTERWQIKNSAGKLGSGIDVRGDDGYVVASPSRHTSGGAYTWLRPLPSLPAPAPLALLEKITEGSRQARSAFPSPKPPAPQAPSTPVMTTGDAVMIAEGKRHMTLVSLAGILRRAGLSLQVVTEALRMINRLQCQPALSDEEVLKLAKSVAHWEAGKLPLQGELQHTNEEPLTQNINDLLVASMPELKWAVPGILPAGLTLLAGKPKMGKSWLALGLALAIASGGVALGRLPVVRGSVLYLSLEDSPRRMKERTQKVLAAMQLANPLTSLWAPQWPVLGSGGLFCLEQWLKEQPEARLIVIDTLVKVRPPSTANGNSYAEDYAIMAPLKQLAEQYGVAILLVHHLRKTSASDPMDEISGSTGLTGATDCNMVLKRERGQMDAVLHITGRDVEEQELALAFSHENALWSLLGPAAEHRLSKERREIQDLLREQQQSLTPAEIAQLLEKPKTNIKFLLSQMFNAGEVMQTEHGHYSAPPD